MSETKYTVSDANSAKSGLGFAASARWIAKWYEDVDSWYDGNSDPVLHSAIAAAIQAINVPNESDGLAGHEGYADAVCETVAEEMGAESFAGHGDYYVSAAAQGGYDLRVSSEVRNRCNACNGRGGYTDADEIECNGGDSTCWECDGKGWT